ncbi:PIN domain-containing protein [Silvibacterium bohemicum]|nr:PIN domain-containing protein [Silvibacterium bohemicum]
MPEPLRVFLDANVLFSAAYKQKNGLLEFWSMPEVQLVTSFYVVQEALRNCTSEDHTRRLESLLAATIIVSDALPGTLPPHIDLPTKDQPVLAAAMNAGADFLITGDKTHFAPWMNLPIETRHGILMITQPRTFLDYLKQRR